MNNPNNNTTIKVLLIMIIISLVILGIMGSIYYFSQSKVKLLYIRANEKFKLGTIEDIRTGIQVFRFLSAKYPKSKYAPKALYQIGQGYELIFDKTKDEKKLNIAIEEYHKVKKYYKNSFESQKALYRIGHINYVMKNYEEAQEKLDYILSEYLDTPLKPEIYTKKGYIYLESHEYEKALFFFNQKVSLNEDLSLLGRAECYFKLGEYEKGLNVYEDFIQYRQTSNYRKKAIQSFLKNCYSYAKKLAKEKDYKRSNMLYDKIISLFPDNKLSENALYWKSENYYDQKLYKDSIQNFKKVLQNKYTAKDDAALFKIGMCYFEQEKFNEALKHFQQIIDFHTYSKFITMAKDWKRQSIREIKYRH